eukprot:TRINITY_DN52236_c0_g1_i2.p3 TRINITY_DN52236_c0_g1~~TRINITY_DN52236_c0_g1_i2.p3  ORF type:complete len:153 (-),score=14.12 TRINITY_DN52236_c0_g1_i2:1257-1715(-)
MNMKINLLVLSFVFFSLLATDAKKIPLNTGSLKVNIPINITDPLLAPLLNKQFGRAVSADSEGNDGTQKHLLEESSLLFKITSSFNNPTFYLEIDEDYYNGEQVLFDEGNREDVQSLAVNVNSSITDQTLVVTFGEDKNKMFDMTHLITSKF